MKGFEATAEAAVQTEAPQEKSYNQGGRSHYTKRSLPHIYIYIYMIYVEIYVKMKHQVNIQRQGYFCIAQPVTPPVLAELLPPRREKLVAAAGCAAGGCCAVPSSGYSSGAWPWSSHSLLGGSSHLVSGL